MKIRNILLLFVLALLFACQPELDDFTTTNGEADFSSYVAIGNSLTAGFADGDLYKSGQENSYPAILAYQFEAAGGGEFKQPLMFDEYGFGKRYLLDASKPGPVNAGVTPSPQNFESIAAQGPYNNMGVPGAKSFHLLAPGYGILNPYYGRFATTSTSSVIEDAAAQQATFFSLWIGANDVLTYATSGGAADSITDIGTFTYAINEILNAMTANDAKGVIANIPDITSIPFFSYVSNPLVLGYNGLVLEAEQAAGLNFAYSQIEAALAAQGIEYSYGFNFTEGRNAFVIADANLPLPAPFNVRQMTNGELFLLTLPTDSLPMGMGSLNPETFMPWGIPNQYVLTMPEKTAIETAIAGYNAVIAQMASTYNLAHVDFNTFFNEVAENGVVVDGITFTTAFILGNTFSLDGVHMTAQGYAVAANKFIDAINAQYNSQLKHVSPTQYPGIYYYQ